MTKTRRKFAADFPEGAARLVRETGKPITQVAARISAVRGGWLRMCGSPVLGADAGIRCRAGLDRRASG
jgi:hypothetical protein